MFLLLCNVRLLTAYLGSGFRTDLTSHGLESITLMLEIQNIMSILADALGQYRDRPSLHQAATLSGIPGKIDVSGDSVADMWADGKLDEIVAYNEFDAFTTHLLWARVAHFSGLLTSEQYEIEQQLVRTLLNDEIEAGRDHLTKFIEEWDRLLTITGQK